MTLHNLSGAPCRVKTDFGDGDGRGHRFVEVLADRDEQPLDEAGGAVPLAAYGYRWFRTELGSGVASASAPSVVSSTRSP